MPKLTIDCDALTYAIDYQRPGSETKVEALLREDPDGWGLDGIYVNGRPPADSHRLGRRGTWQKALHDALVYLESRAKAYDEVQP